MADTEARIQDLGQGGLIKDRPAHTLGPGQWNVANNVSMRDGIIRSAAGLSVVPRCYWDLEIRHLLPFSVGEKYFWNQAGVVQGNGYICLTDGAAARDVTPTAGLSVEDTAQWSGGILNGIPVLCNGHGNPPFYLPNPDSDGIWTPLPFNVSQSWSERDIACGVLRPFKNFLFAGNIQRDAGYFPQMVMWSNIADPGTIPYWQDWTSLDPTSLGGEVTLGEIDGAVVDFVPLHDLLMIYTEVSTWTASLVRSTNVFKIRKALSTVGALSPNCVASWKGGHVVLGDGDIVLHNGTSARSIVADRIRRHLFRGLDIEAYRNSFLAIHHENQEVWVCMPQQGAEFPTFAAVWNWRHDTWTIQDLPVYTHWLTYGVDVFETVQTTDAWGSELGELDIEGNPIDQGDVVPYTPAVWGGDGTPVPYNKPWGSRSFNPTLRTLVGAFHEKEQQIVVDRFTNTNGTLLTAHSSDIGGSIPWVQATGYSGSHNIQNNRAVTVDNNTGFVYKDVNQSDLLFQFQFNWWNITETYMVVRASAVGVWYRVIIDFLNTEIRLEENFGPGPTILATHAVSPTPDLGSVHTIRAICRGSTIVVYYDFQHLFTYNNMGLVNNTWFGFMSRRTDCWIDNLIINHLEPKEGLFKVDPDLVTWFGKPITQLCERQGVPLLDYDQYGVLNRVYPLIASDGPVNFYVGSQDHPTGEVTWEGPFPFDPNSDEFFSPLVNGRLFAFRLQVDQPVSFQWYGLKAYLTPTGSQ